jgi:hypothetical protein
MQLSLHPLKTSFCDSGHSICDVEQILFLQQEFPDCVHISFSTSFVIVLLSSAKTKDSILKKIIPIIKEIINLLASIILYRKFPL